MGEGVQGRFNPAPGLPFTKPKWSIRSEDAGCSSIIKMDVLKLQFYSIFSI